MNDLENPYEEIEIRCPRLGGPVTFGYCVIEAIDRPCARSITCWSDHFEVESFLRNKLGDELFQLTFNTPQKTKLDSILELIERAKKSSFDNSERPE
jgi:hypothetical protein